MAGGPARSGGPSPSGSTTSPAPTDDSRTAGRAGPPARSGTGCASTCATTVPSTRRPTSAPAGAAAGPWATPWPAAATTTRPGSPGAGGRRSPRRRPAALVGVHHRPGHRPGGLNRAAEALDLYDEARPSPTTEDHDVGGVRHRHAARPAPAGGRPGPGAGPARAGAGAVPRRRAGRPAAAAVVDGLHEQGLALLDSRAGRPDRALRLVDDGLACLTAALAPGERPQDLARLRHNRAQVHLALGDPARALADAWTP
ncbi:tetratricopeptide repeat protein [Micromonospora sp. BRA006-A]|nr:tetratricopeptide repeat protein [Micromonospora sp. BRA006-A]